MNHTGTLKPGHDRMVDLALWCIAAGCALTTVWFSFGAEFPGVHAFHGADKVGHAIAYFATTLSFLFAAVWRPGRGPGRFPRAGYWLPVAAVAAGGVIEILQGMTPTRNAHFDDFLADLVGAALGLGVHTLVRWRSSASPEPEPSRTDR